MKPPERIIDPGKIVPEMDNKVLELVDKYADGGPDNRLRSSWP